MRQFGGMQRPQKLIFLAALTMVAAGLISIGLVLFLYSGDLPNIERLARFAPGAPTVVSDPCLASSPTALPSRQLGLLVQEAIEAAEPPDSESSQISRSLLCDRRRTNLRFALDAIRLDWQIRLHFSKGEIRTIFANRAYFGLGIVGVENASMRLFDKHTDQLDLAEAATLVGVIRAPERDSPLQNASGALLRRNRVLEAMVTTGKLAADAAAKAEAEPVPTK